MECMIAFLFTLGIRALLCSMWPSGCRRRNMLGKNEALLFPPQSCVFFCTPLCCLLRYALLEAACREEGLSALLTAHHADDQVGLAVSGLLVHRQAGAGRGSLLVYRIGGTGSLWTDGTLPRWG